MTQNGTQKIEWKWTITLFAAMIAWAIMDVVVEKARANVMRNISAENSYLCTGNVNKILIEKSNKKMTLFDDMGCVVKTYDVVTGKNKGPKQCDGDKKTPEGIYKIIEKRDSKYHKFLALDYPRTKDIKKAKELGCKPGDSIGIHGWIEGLPMSGSLGCIRVKTKEEILEIDNLVTIGTEVEIRE